MSVNKAPQRQCKSESEIRNVGVSMVGKLDSGELLTGTPTVTEVTTSDLTFSNEAVNIAELTINGKTVAIGQAVQFRVSGGTAGTDYDIRIQVDTDASPTQTLISTIELEVIAD